MPLDYNPHRVIGIIPVFNEVGKIGKVISKFSNRFIDEICIILDSPSVIILNEIINEVKKTEKTRFKVKAKKGELVSAFPLVRGEKKEILGAVYKRLGRKISFDEKVDKNLVAGVVIKLDTFVVDGSLENRLRRLEQK